MHRDQDATAALWKEVVFLMRNALCLVHKDYTVPSDMCMVNPNNCPSGLSISVWYKGEQGLDRDWEFFSKDPSDPSIIESILSTGGDTKGHPGLFLYQQGMTTTAVVSTGVEYWTVSSIGMILSNKWTNLGISWSKDNGLQLYIDRSLVGSVTYPTLNPTALPAVDPPEMMLGCHKDATNTTYRGYNTAAFDELAIWDRSLIGDKVVYFMGGYIKEYEDLSLEDVNSLVDNADLNNPDTAAVAYKITAQKTLSEDAPNGGSVVTTPATTTTTATTITTASGTGQIPITTTETAMTTLEPESEEEENFKNLLKLHKKFSKSAPKGVEIPKLQRILALVDVESNIFSEKNKEFLEELTIKMLDTEEGEKETVLDPNEIMQDLTNWTLQVLQNINFGNRTELFMHVKETDNFIVNLFKAPLSELTQGTNNFIVAPKCSMMNGKDSWNNTCNRAAVSNSIVSHPNCSDRNVNLAITAARNLHRVSPPTVNSLVLNPRRPYVLNSMVLSVEMSVNPPFTGDGEVDKNAPECKPDPAALLETPIRLKLFHLHHDSHPHQRKLLFHENDTIQRVDSRHCAWWNANVSGWDATGCVVMMETELYTKCACAHLGMFAVVDQLVEPRVVPEEHLWLTVLRYMGYSLSIFFVVGYIVVVLVSRDLKDQFHLMGVNLSVAVLVGAAAMVASDLRVVRDARHLCTAIGTLIHFFSQAAGAWVFCIGHAAHRAVTAGVIGGRLKSYLSISWGMPLISVGLTYLLYLMDLGEDPRCFISWENPSKWVFFGFQLVFIAVSGACACVVLCNMATTALRKDNLIEDYGSFCHGAAFLLLFFDVTWLFGIPCYLHLGIIETDFYPIFQVLNSWTGVVLFLFIGLASRRFKMVVAGQAKLRREMLKGYAFGKHGKMKDADDPVSSSSFISAGKITKRSPPRSLTAE